MAWYNIFRIKEKIIKKTLEENMRKNDFFEGMGSVYDLSGERHFNDFENYPSDPRERIWRHWHNVGIHLHNAMDSFAKQNNLPRPSSFDKNPHY